eukprot:734651-Pelagomonas_calceolata.AAC.1
MLYGGHFKTAEVWWVIEGKKIKEKLCRQRNSPDINQGKRDTLAQKSLESSPPRSYKKKILMGIWRVIGSTRLHDLAAKISVFSRARLVVTSLLAYMAEWA